MPGYDGGVHAIELVSSSDCIPSLTPKAAFDKLAVDNADQKASFDNQMAKAEAVAGEMKASFDNQMAKAESDAGEMKASFDNQMAKATLDAGDMKASSFCFPF